MVIPSINNAFISTVTSIGGIKNSGVCVCYFGELREQKESVSGSSSKNGTGMSSCLDFIWRLLLAMQSL